MFRRKIQFENSNGIEENRSALEKRTSQTILSPFSLVKDGPYDFEGKIEYDRFLLRSVVGYRTSFLPMIQGNFIEKDGKTMISTSVFLGKAMFYTILAFSLLAFFMGIFILFVNPIMVLIPLFFIAFVWGLTAICFYIEATKSIKILKEIFQE